MEYSQAIKNTITRLLMILGVLIALSACGGGSSGSGGGESLNLNGRFNVTSQTNASGFSGGSGTADITQQGSQISGTVTPDPTPSGLVDCFGGNISFTGVVSGDRVTITGQAVGGSFSAELTGTSDRLTGEREFSFNGRFCRGSNTGTLTLSRI